MGVDLDKFDRMSGGFTYLSGGPLRNPDDILIDELLCRPEAPQGRRHLPLLNHDWRVAGIIDGGKLARIVVTNRCSRNWMRPATRSASVWVKCDRPSQADEVAAQLERLLPGYPIYTMEDFTSMFSVEQRPGPQRIHPVIVGIGVVIGFAVVCLSMYMAVLQRTREIGILKSLGASKAFILRIILAEALIIGVGGTVLGIVMSFGAWWLIHIFVPASLPMVIVRLGGCIAGG